MSPTCPSEQQLAAKGTFQEVGQSTMLEQPMCGAIRSESMSLLDNVSYEIILQIATTGSLLASDLARLSQVNKRTSVLPVLFTLVLTKIMVAWREQVCKAHVGR